MRIGIIGAGNIGGTLTRRFSQLGHEVSVANSRGPETLSELAAETGARAVTVEEAARDQDVVVAWRQQPETPVYAADLDAAGVREALAPASPERKPEFNATGTRPGTYAQAR